MFTGPYVASKFKNVRTYVMMVWLLPTLVAACLFWQLPRSNKGGLLAGYYMVDFLFLSMVTPLIIWIVCVFYRFPYCGSPDARL